MKILKTLYKIANVMVWSVILLLFTSNMWVILTTRNKVFEDMDKLPNLKTALVLGTSKRVVGGDSNPYFQYRIEAVAELYKQGKVKKIILSGDNSSKYYNEPLDMQKALVKLGVPKSATTLDYAGLRTLDSVVRCKEVFGSSDVIIVTQKFHSYRALFISHYYKMNSYAYVADNPSIDRSFKVLFREILARPKAILDLYFADVDLSKTE